MSKISIILLLLLIHSFAFAEEDDLVVSSGDGVVPNAAASPSVVPNPPASDELATPVVSPKTGCKALEQVRQGLGIEDSNSDTAIKAGAGGTAAFVVGRAVTHFSRANWKALLVDQRAGILKGTISEYMGSTIERYTTTFAGQSTKAVQDTLVPMIRQALADNVHVLRATLALKYGKKVAQKLSERFIVAIGDDTLLKTLIQAQGSASEALALPELRATLLGWMRSLVFPSLERAIPELARTAKIGRTLLVGGLTIAGGAVAAVGADMVFAEEGYAADDVTEILLASPLNQVCEEMQRPQGESLRLGAMNLYHRYLQGLKMQCSDVGCS